MAEELLEAFAFELECFCLMNTHSRDLIIIKLMN